MLNHIDHRATSRIVRHDYARPADELAHWLLGATLVRVLPGGERLAGTIVETEAYMGVADRAAHSFGGRRTKRTETMYAAAGTAYVYFTYGMHHCFNIVCGASNLGIDVPEAVLIRAVEPIEGCQAMISRRAGSADGTPPARILKPGGVGGGPAKLCQAFEIDRSSDRVDLTASQSLYLEYGSAGQIDDTNISNTARIGVAYAHQ